MIDNTIDPVLLDNNHDWEIVYEPSDSDNDSDIFFLDLAQPEGPLTAFTEANLPAQSPPNTTESNILEQPQWIEKLTSDWIQKS